MKKLFLLIACLAVMTAYAQNSGLGFNYQAVLRNSEGITLTDTPVNLRVSLYAGQYASTPTWVETHSTLTDFTGAFGITVGQGERDASSMVEDFGAINFAAFFYWIRIEILDDNTYQLVSYTQIPIMKVRYDEPAGVIHMFVGSIDRIPEGYLICDGSAVSKDDYPELYAVIGTGGGNGDGSITFNLPDFRGRFPRGVSGDSGNDPDADTRYNEFGGNQGNDVITYQDFAIPNITGTFKTFDRGVTSVSGVFYDTDDVWSSNVKGGNGDDWGAVTGYDASRVTNTSTEARPNNVSVYFIIKY